MRTWTHTWTASKLLNMQLMSGLICCVLGSCALCAWGQTKPGAGDLLNNIAPFKKATPELKKRSDKLLIENHTDQATDIPETDSTNTLAMSFEVQGLLLQGHTVFSTQELLALLPNAFPGMYTLQQLEMKLSVLTEHYRLAGYTLAQARIPEQVLQNGVVRVQITEPVWGQVLLNNQSQINDNVLMNAVSAVMPGSMVRQADLESALLRMNDLPGTRFNSQLQPGKLPNTTDVFISALPTQPVTGATTVDNFGSRYTGRQRATATLIWSNPLRVGDMLTANVLTSGPWLNYQRVAYEWPVFQPGMQLGLSTAKMNYRLGEGAESLRAHGQLGQQAVWLDYPWTRNSHYQLKSRVQWEYMDPRDHQDASNIKTDRQLRVLSLSTNQENADSFMAGGLNQVSAELTHGQTQFTDQVAAANDASTARTAGRFTKVNLRAYRNQTISATFSLSLSMDSQWAQKNLDATQKFSLGGMRSVRAYEAGVLSTDHALFSSVELRMLLPQPGETWNIQGRWYACVFWDKAVAQVNKNPWNNTSNRVHLRGSGLAMYWQGPNEWRATASVGKSLGVSSSLLGGANAMHKTAWLELAKAWR